MFNSVEDIPDSQEFPVCYQNPFLKTQVQWLTHIAWQNKVCLLLSGGALYKIYPSDLDFLVPDCSVEEIAALFRYLQYKKNESTTQPPLPNDLAYNLVSAITDLLSKDGIQFVDTYEKVNRKRDPSHAASSQAPQQTSDGVTKKIIPDSDIHDVRTVTRHVLKITSNGFPVDIIFSTGSAYEYANAVDFASAGIIYDAIANYLYFYNEQSWVDFTNGELNYLHPEKLKKDPTILLRTIRALATSVIPLSEKCQQLIHEHLNENKSVFSALRPDRLYHDLKLSFFSGHAVVNLYNLRCFQLFDQLFGYTIPQSESALKLQQYLIDNIAVIIDANPSAYHPSLWYYAIHWEGIKTMAYENHLFEKHLTSLSQPTILIPQEERSEKLAEEPKDQTNSDLRGKVEPKNPKKKRNYSPNEILTAEIDQSHRKLLTQLEEQYHLTDNDASTSVSSTSTSIATKKTYAAAIKTPPSLNIELIYTRQIPSHDDSQSTKKTHGKQENHRSLKSSNTKKRLRTKPVTAPLIIEKDTSYERLCQQGNHFLTPECENPQDAIFYFQSAQEMQPGFPEAYVGLGKIAQIEAEQMKNTVEKFRTQFQKMSERGKDTPALKSQTRDCQKGYKHYYNMMMGKYAQARGFYEQALAKNPVDRDILSKQLENILQAIEAHEKTEKTISITKKVKRVKAKAKNSHKSATQRDVDAEYSIFTFDDFELDLDFIEKDSHQPVTQKDVDASASDSTTDESDLDLGFTEQEQKNFSAAKKHYETYLNKQQKTRPNTGRYTFYYSLAEKLRSKIYQGKSNYQLSNQKKSEQIDLLDFLVSCYSKAIHYLSAETFHDAHIRIAEIKFDLNDYQGVIDTLKPILESSSENCLHQYSREKLAVRIAEACEKNKAYEQAKEYYQVAIHEAVSKQRDVTAMESAIANIEKRQQAIAEVNRIRAENTEKAAKAFEVALTQQEEKQYEEAIETLKRVIKLDNKHLLAYRQLIDAYCAIGNYTDAIFWSNFLVDIDEARYNRDYLPTQKDASMPHKYHWCISIYQRGNIYLESVNQGSSNSPQTIDLGLKDLQDIIAAYSISKDPSFKENFREIMASCCLILGQNSQLSAQCYRKKFKENMQKLGYQSDTNMLLNHLITQSIIQAISQRNNTASSHGMMPKAIVGIIPKELISNFLSHIPSSEISLLAHFINEIITLEHKTVDWLGIAIDLMPNLYQTHCCLGTLEKSRNQIDKAKSYYLTSLEKIAIEHAKSFRGFDDFNHLARSVNHHACALRFSRISSGITEEITQEPAASKTMERDWIDFSKQFYQKAAEHSPIGQWTPNSHMLGIIDYIQQDYPSALITFGTIIYHNQFAQTESVQRELLFYCGKSYQNLGQLEKARNCYEGVCNQEPYESDDPNLTDRLRSLGKIALKEIAGLQEYKEIVTNAAETAINQAMTSISEFAASARAMNSGNGAGIFKSVLNSIAAAREGAEVGCTLS